MGVCAYGLKEYDPIEVAKQNALKKEVYHYNVQQKDWVPSEKDKDENYEHKKDWNAYRPI